MRGETHAPLSLHSWKKGGTFGLKCEVWLIISIISVRQWRHLPLVAAARSKRCCSLCALGPLHGAMLVVMYPVITSEQHTRMMRQNSAKVLLKHNATTCKSCSRSHSGRHDSQCGLHDVPS